MATDGEAAAEIGRQMALLRGRVARRGVMGYLDDGGERKDVNKLFLANTVRSVDAHNRRHEEAKCWKIRELEDKLDKRDRSRSRSRTRSRSRRCRGRSRSRSASADRQRRRRDGGRTSRSGDGGRRDRSTSRSRRERESKRRAGRRRRSASPSPPSERRAGESERDFWARRKAERTEKMWEKLHEGSGVTVENAPTFGSADSDESSDGDVKVRKPKKKEKSKSKKRSKRREG